MVRFPARTVRMIQIKLYSLFMFCALHTFVSCCPSESSTQYLSIEATIGAVYASPRHGEFDALVCANPNALPYLLKLVQQSSEKIPARAIMMIGIVGGPTEVETLADLLRETFVEDDEEGQKASTAAVIAISRICE